MSRGRTIILGFCLAMLPFLMAAKPVSRQFRDAETVELFSAIKAGDIEVNFIPKDATQANVIVRNLSKKPLRIEMPAAFSGVPVLAQDDFGGDFGGGGGGNNNNQQQGQQALGGGLGGGGGFGGGGGLGGGGVFNVAPERARKVKVRTVCLEHGKKDPNPRVKYEIKPLEAFTSNPHVHELCTMLGRGQLDQVSAQAAAWHLTDGMSYRQLASKVKTKHLNGTVDMYFNPRQLQQASKIVEYVKLKVAKQKSNTEVSPGEKETEL